MPSIKMKAQTTKAFQRNTNIELGQKRMQRNELVENIGTPNQPTIGVYDDVVECTPESIYKALIGCFGLLISLLLVFSLGITAGGVFWTAQSMNALTSGERHVLVSFQNLDV